MTTYPDVAKIRASLKTADEDRVIANRFHDEALKVCDEADHATGPMMDVQTIAKLQFIERVLNG